MIRSWSPGRDGRSLRPLFAVARTPHIVLQTLGIAKVVVLGSAQDPHLAIEHDRGRCQPCAPRSLRGLVPVRAVGTGPHFARGFVPRQTAIVPAAQEPNPLAK